MATFWIVPSIDYLHRVTDAHPGYGVETADGFKTIAAVGVGLVHFLLDGVSGGDCAPAYQ